MSKPRKKGKPHPEKGVFSLSSGKCAGMTRHFGGAEFVITSTHSTKEAAKKQGLELKKRAKKRKIKFRVVQTPKRHRKAGSRYDLLISSGK